MTCNPATSNPRQRRAYAHALRARANAHSSVETVTAAMEQDFVLARGPLKSRRMVGAASVRALLADYQVVFRWDDFSMTERHGDTTAVRWPAMAEHLGGVVTKQAATQLQERTPLSHGDLHVMCGIARADRLADDRLRQGGTLPLVDALAMPELLERGWDLWGQPYDIAGDTVRQQTLRQAARVIIRRELET